MKTCKKHIKDPVICYSDCAGCEIQRLTDERNQLRSENQELRKGWYLNECGDNRFWPEEMEELKAESDALRKAITDIDDALYREYWSEYAGLENTRAILDAAMRKDGQS